MFRSVLYLSAALAFSAPGRFAVAQTSDDAVRLTVTMNPDGSKTVYQTDGPKRQTIATTTGADGKPGEKIVYHLDADGRYESGQVFAPDGTLRFKTRYRYDTAGRLLDETQLAKDDSVRNKIIYSYDTAGHQTGYAVYDGKGELLGRTTARKSAPRDSKTKR